jgi:hypothetical protein
MRDTEDKTYHERVANGNSCIVVLVKNFHFGLIIGIGRTLTVSPLPHHQAYGSVPWRFDRVKHDMPILIEADRARRNRHWARLVAP